MFVLSMERRFEWFCIGFGLVASQEIVRLLALEGGPIRIKIVKSHSGRRHRGRAVVETNDETSSRLNVTISHEEVGHKTVLAHINIAISSHYH